MDLSEQSILSEVAKNDPNADIRRKAVKKLTDQTAIGEVAKNDVKTDIRIMALKKLKDQNAIAEVAKNDHKTDVRMRALKKLTDIPALFEIAKSDSKTDIRRIALKKIKKLTNKNKSLHTAGIDAGDISDNIENIKIIENETDIFERISSFISEIDVLEAILAKDGILYKD